MKYSYASRPPSRRRMRSAHRSLLVCPSTRSIDNLACCNYLSWNHEKSYNFSGVLLGPPAAGPEGGGKKRGTPPNPRPWDCVPPAPPLCVPPAAGREKKKGEMRRGTASPASPVE